MGSKLKPCWSREAVPLVGCWEIPLKKPLLHLKKKKKFPTRPQFRSVSGVCISPWKHCKCSGICSDLQILCSSVLWDTGVVSIYNANWHLYCITAHSWEAKHSSTTAFCLYEALTRVLLREQLESHNVSFSIFITLCRTIARSTRRKMWNKLLKRKALSDGWHYFIYRKADVEQKQVPWKLGLLPQRKGRVWGNSDVQCQCWTPVNVEEVQQDQQ